MLGEKRSAEKVEEGGVQIKDKMQRCKFHRPLQKRERTGKEYGCFPFV